MQKDYQNKAITEAKTKGQEIEFHFPGSGEHEPMTIKATSREEAQAIWEKNRKPIKAESIKEEAE